MDRLTRLLLDARDGDRGAFAAAVRTSQPEVWRLCAHLVDRASADDLTQDTYLRVVGALAAFRGDASGRTWILAIARRACADELRRRVRRRRRRGLADADTVPSPAGEVAGRDLLERLDPDRREAFVLTQVLGCSYAEAAEACGVPVGTIRSRVARARRDLVDQLHDEESAAG